MGANEEQLGKLRVQIEADLQKITFDMDKLKGFVSRRAEEMEKEFKKKKMRFDDTLMKKSVTDLIALRKKLKAQFEERVRLNFDIQSISQSRNQLEAVDRALRGVGETAVKTESKTVLSFKRIAGALGLAFGVRQLFNFGKQAIASFGEEELSIRKLDTALGKHSQSLIDYAATLQKVTTFEDDQIIETEARISAFTKEENQIKKLTLATLDFATAKGIDLVSASDIVSKSFGSSVNALARYGVQVEGAAGSSERLESITKGIADLWGGQALSAARTETGQLKIMNNEIKDQEETIGGKLIPIWRFATGVIAGSMEFLIQVGRNMRKDYDNIALGIKNLLGGQINFWDFLTNQMETNEQRLKRFGSLLIPAHTTSSGAGNNQEVQLKGYTKIVKEIDELNQRLQEENLSLEEAAKIQTQIDEKTKQITFETEKQKNAVDELVKKVQTENQLKELTKQLTVSTLLSAKKTLEAGLALAKNDEERLKILQAIDQVDKAIKDRKGTSKRSDPDLEGAKKEKQRAEDRKQIEQDLASLRIASIDNEFDQRRAQIEQEFEAVNEKYKELYEERKISEEELQEALQENQKAKQRELLKIERDRFNNMMSVANQIGDLLINKLGIAGHTFVGQMMRALDIASSIISILGQLGDIFGGGGGGGLFGLFASFIPGGSLIASAAGARAGGGPVERDKVYKVGEHGVELFKPATSGVIIPNHQIASNIVNRGGVSSSGNGDVVREIRILSDRVGAMNMNLVKKELSVSVHNNAPGVKSTVVKNEKVKNELNRSGLSFNER